MAVSENPRFVPGVWGQYYSAMIPGLWLTEGGQSATGVLIDHVLQSHPRWHDLQAAAKQNARSAYEEINDHVARLAASTGKAYVGAVSRPFWRLYVHDRPGVTVISSSLRMALQTGLAI